MKAESGQDLFGAWPEQKGLVAGFGGQHQDFDAAEFVTVKQVHGTRVLDANGLAPGFHESVEADALVVSQNGRIVAVRTADCVPILLVARRQCWAAAVHAGWRGTLAGIVGEAVLAAREAGVAAGELGAAIGPAIGPCCYEVGEDVAGQFEDHGHEVVRVAGRPVLDLSQINRSLLVKAGLNPENVRVHGPCTRCHADRFYSYRADSSETGRQLSWIGFVAGHQNG